MMRKIKSYFSLVNQGYAFTDTVSGKPVNYYKDCYGDWYMKESRWSPFSVVAIQNAKRRKNG